jgi:hypothetical protein
MLLVSCFSGWAENLESLKKKEINQSFNVSLRDQLSVDNKYGSITVAHWDKNEVEIRVVIESKASSDRLAQEGLDRVSINMGKSGSIISAATLIRNNYTGSNSSLTIRYFITMPSKLATTLSQQYGDINLPEKNQGKCSIEVRYGNLRAGSFSEDLSIDAKYSNITLADAVEVRIDAAYCGNINLNNVDVMAIDCRYSNLRLRDAGRLSIDNRYGSIKAENVNNLSIESRYGSANIEYVKESIRASTLDYGSLTVNRLDAAFKSVDAAARYGTLKLKVPSQASFRISAGAMKYGNLKIKGLTITNSATENNNHSYQINGGGSASIRFDGNNYSSFEISAL